MNMVDRVAMGQLAALIGKDRPDMTPEAMWACLNAKNREIQRAAARAAILAMREPSEGMVEAALDDPSAAYCDRCMQSGHERNAGHPVVTWNLMIDAALSEDSSHG